MLVFIQTLAIASFMYFIPGCDWIKSHPKEVAEIIEDVEDIGKTIIEGTQKPSMPPIIP